MSITKNIFLWNRLLAACLGAALCLLAGGVMAADYYVTPAGAGDYGGTNWHNAYSNVQAAASLATNAGGDTIFLRWGVYSNASQLVISNAPNVMLQGGCWGLSGGSSNDYSGTNSILTKTGGVMRIFYGQSSTMTLANVTVSGAYFAAGANFGAGLLFTNCGVTLTNCVVRDNTNIFTVRTNAYGGGLCAMGGSLTLLDCSFFKNQLTCGGGGYGSPAYGGGIAAVNCPLVVRGSGSVFSNNAVIGDYDRLHQAGGAIYVTNGTLILDGITFLTNYLYNSVGRGQYGGAVYHSGSGTAATITNCQFNGNSGWSSIEGGTIYLGGSTGVIVNCVFTNNCKDFASRGGYVFASGLQSLEITSNLFYDNNVDVGGAGGGIAATNCAALVINGCMLDGSIVCRKDGASELVHVGGSGTGLVANTILRNNMGGHGLTFAAGADSALTLVNCQSLDNRLSGINIKGNASARVSLTNCLVVDNLGNGLAVSNVIASLRNCVSARNVQDGINLQAGTATVANCTLVYNGGWGLNRSGGTGTVVNSIAWGNTSGGVVSNENVWVNYSCLQAAAFGGGSNVVSDPLFAAVAGCYYLSVSGLTGQTVSSSCIAAGSNSAAFWGLTNRTTRTDGAGDTNAPVDLGYHYDSGNSNVRTVSNCYVDAANGSDTNSGLAWATAWKTLTKALSNVTANARINVAIGVYNSANGEAFPLTAQMCGLTLAASNALPALTVVDNAGTNGQRVFQAKGMRSVALHGLTFRGGRFATGQNYGAGLYFQGCDVTLSNCVVRDNTNMTEKISSTHGGGLYAVGGPMAVFDSVFCNNRLVRNNSSPSQYGGCNGGGGLAVEQGALTIRGSGSVFSNNIVEGDYDAANDAGAAIFVTNGALVLADATFVTNRLIQGVGRIMRGGAVYHAGSGATAMIARCRFADQTASGGSTVGGALYLAGSTAVIASCVFTNNGGGTVSPGGAVCAEGVQVLQSISNEFQYNRVVAGGNGGAFFATNCTVMAVNDCVFDGLGISTGQAPELVYVGGNGAARISNCVLRNNSAGRGLYFGVGAAGATLGLTNCLVARNAGDGLLISSGAVTVVNCTLANNAGWGIARPTATALTVKNSIFWGNSYGGIGHNQNLALTYTDSQDAWVTALGIGNISADPLFVDAAGGDYHEMGVEGSWHGGAWAPDARNSPCLDAGDPASDWSLEPKPCGNRINLGAYGNTAEATRSLPKAGTVLRVW